jgi:hypothetical protein
LEDVDIGDVGPALARALQATGTRMLRVRTDRVQNQRRLCEVTEAVTKQARAVLESEVGS